MPRPRLKNRWSVAKLNGLEWRELTGINCSETCRFRKVKCDGQHPICEICRKTGRQCDWETEKERDRFSVSDFQDRTPPSPDQPPEALSCAFISTLYRHYITTLASWYDLNDSQRRFQDIISLESRSNPLLFSAILAFSCIHLYRRGAGDNEYYLFVAEFYHLQSIQKLIALTGDLSSFPFDGATLAATCLLRSYEILAQNVAAQSHLLGSSSFLRDQQIHIGASDLLSAGFWNYLREDITVALVEKRRLKIELDQINIPYPPTRDDERANLISLLLGRAINICFGDSARPDVGELRNLESEVAQWKSDLPSSFDPIQSSKVTNRDEFPILWLYHGWHIAALQYYYTLLTIISLVSLTSETRADPSSYGILQKASDLLTSAPRILDKIEDYAIRVCALAISNDCDAARVNAFGPTAFCGAYLRNKKQRARLINELKGWEEKTGWPAESILLVLQNAWDN